MSAVASRRKKTAKLGVLNGYPELQIQENPEDSKKVYRHVLLSVPVAQAVLGLPIVPVGEGPDFTVNESSRIFFAKNPWWFRYQEKSGTFNRGDEVLTITRTESSRRGGKGDRRFFLSDIDWIAHALFENDVIDEAQFFLTLQTIWMVAQQYGLISK